MCIYIYISFIHIKMYTFICVHIYIYIPIYWGAPVCGNVFPYIWGARVYGNAFPFTGVPTIRERIPIYWGAPVYGNAFPLTGVPQYMEMHSPMIPTSYSYFVGVGAKGRLFINLGHNCVRIGMSFRDFEQNH